MVEFYASEDRVYSKPEDTGEGITLGFKILTVSESVASPNEVAILVADLLTEYYKRQEATEAYLDAPHGLNDES